MEKLPIPNELKNLTHLLHHIEETLQCVVKLQQLGVTVEEDPEKVFLGLFMVNICKRNGMIKPNDGNKAINDALECIGFSKNKIKS